MKGSHSFGEGDCVVAVKSEEILKHIYCIVERSVEPSRLKEQLSQYVDYQSKSRFLFGELLVLHYTLCKGRKTEDIYAVAAAVEMLILSFDMLDDFEDNDSQEKPWMIDSHLALNATTALLFLSIETIRKTRFAHKEGAIAILTKYALEAISGQHRDLLNNCKTEAEYIEMTLQKSGSLVKLACLIGASLATDNYPKEIYHYAKWIGLIGQINNDLVDIQRWNEKNDLLHKKYTLPIIYLLNEPDDELNFIRDYYDHKIEKREIRKHGMFINEKLVATGAITYTYVIRRLYQNKVRQKIRKAGFTKHELYLLENYFL